MTTTGVALYVGPAMGFIGQAAVYDLEPAYEARSPEGDVVYWSQVIVSAVDLPTHPSLPDMPACETMVFGVTNGVPDFNDLACIRGRKNHHDMLAELGYAEALSV